MIVSGGQCVAARVGYRQRTLSTSLIQKHICNKTLEQYLKVGIHAPIVPLDSCIHVPIGFGHRWSFPIQAHVVLLHVGTDGPIAFVHTWSYWIRTQMVHVFGHRWSLSYSGTDGPVAFGHRWSHRIRAYMFLLDLDTDGPFPNQAQMILVHLGTDGPIAFVHTSSYGNQTKMAPCSRAQMVSIQTQMVLLHLGTDGPIALGHRWSLFYSGTDSPIVFGHR